MKKAHYGPYYRFLVNRFYGKKIIGRGSQEEVNSLCKIVAKTIAKVDSKRTEEEILKDLSKKLKITFTEQLPVMSGAQGLSSFNTIFIDKEDFDGTIEAKPEDLIDNGNYETIVHESIHKLQSPRRQYRGTNIVGFIEGATELMALRANSKPRSHDRYDGSVKWNFPPTAYNNLVSIVAQLEVMFGKENTEDFALRSDMGLMDKTIELLGKRDFKDLGRDLARDARGKEPGTPITHWQNILMQRYFDGKIRNINSQEQAESFLEQLKELEKVRIKVKNEDYYEKFYRSKLDILKQKFPELDVEKYSYKETEFYPKIYFDEEIRIMDRETLNRGIIIPETLEEFESLDLSKYKRYRFVKDQSIYEAVVRDNKDVMFNFIDEDNRPLVKYLGGKFKDRDVLAAGLDVVVEDGKVTFSSNPPIGKYSIDAQEMEEIPLNVNKKDIYEEMLEREKLDIMTETFGEKIARIFRRQKKLPPYTEILPYEQQAATPNNSNEKPSWELTEEQRQKANSVEIKLQNQENTKSELIENNKKELEGEEY